MMLKIEVPNKTLSQLVDDVGVIDTIKRLKFNDRLSYISETYKIGKNTQIHKWCNLFGNSTIGSDCVIGSYTEIQGGVVIGNNCRIGSHCFICSGVTIEENVFLGSGIVTINDRLPTPNNKNYKQEKTLIKKGASIGSGAVIMCGIVIGENTKVGAGSVVVKDVAPNTIVVGNPAKPIKRKKK
jgi:acetyltransferase-like isoleucine patch superfamily enzyme